MAGRVIGLALLCCALAAGPAHAIDIGVDPGTELNDAPDATPGDGSCASTASGNPCTVRAAIQEADALPGNDRVLIPAGNFELSTRIDLTLGQGDLIVEGFTAATTSLKGVGGQNLFRHNTATSFGITFRDLTLQGGRDDTGSVFLDQGTGVSRLRFERDRLVDNRPATSGGPAVRLSGTTSSALDFVESEVDHNQDGNATSPGPGLIRVDGSMPAVSVLVQGSDFHDNDSAPGGSQTAQGLFAISPGAAGAQIVVAGSYFDNNDIAVGGSTAGGIFRVTSGIGSAMSVAGSEFSGNRFGLGGGASGGAISWAPGNASTLAVDRSSFTFNSAGPSSLGVGIGASGGNAASSVSVTNSYFEGNTAGSNSMGGAVRTQTPGPESLVNDTFLNNGVGAGAGSDGGAVFGNSGEIVARNDVFFGNTKNGAPDDCYTKVQDQGGNVQPYNEAGLLDPLGCRLVLPVRAAPAFGALGANGGTIASRVPAPGSSAIDSGVGSCPGPDIRGVGRPQGAACDSGADEFVPPAAVDASTGDGGSVPAPAALLPVLARSVLIQPAGGRPTYEPKGEKSFRPLTGITSIPVGSIIDTRGKGAKVLIISIKPDGTLQGQAFYEGLFRVGQNRDGKLELDLVEKLSCGKKAAKSAVAAKKGPRKRHLWGSGKGSARTNGKYGSALVRGTTWGTFDTCRDTTIKVKEGVVTAFDLVKRIQKTVTAGKKYVARARR